MVYCRYRKSLSTDLLCRILSCRNESYNTWRDRPATDARSGMARLFHPQWCSGCLRHRDTGPSPIAACRLVGILTLSISRSDKRRCCNSSQGKTHSQSPLPLSVKVEWRDRNQYGIVCGRGGACPCYCYWPHFHPFSRME